MNVNNLLSYSKPTCGGKMNSIVGLRELKNDPPVTAQNIKLSFTCLRYFIGFNSFI